MKRFVINVIIKTTALLGLLGTPVLVHAEPPKVLLFEVQEVNQRTYFHLRLLQPADLAMDAPTLSPLFASWNDLQMADPWGRPRLVPQDDAARLVYLREALIERSGDKDEAAKDEPGVEPKNQNPSFESLDFYGVLNDKKAATFLLIYPKAHPERPLGKKLKLQELLQAKIAWIEEKVQLDLAQAKKVPVPAEGFNRDGKKPVTAKDLEGNWALAQAAHFAMHEAQTPSFDFYGFARETTNRQYKVEGPEAFRDRRLNPRATDPTGTVGEVNRHYEVMTGAAAITETLALERIRRRASPPSDQIEARTVPIGTVPAIDIAEHPWKKMMGGKMPATEPLAQWVPHDNYYIHFRTFGKFLEASDFLDEWGTALVRAYEVQSRDYRVKQKLEQQICLQSTGLARLFGPAVIKGLAITGNDPYLREGSDFTILFQVANQTLFRSGAEPMLAATKAKFAKSLQVASADYQGITIESFVTPLREVSLYRAFVDDVAIYSNSGVAVRRVIDTHRNKIKRLADALDFQYMRTVFRADDPAENGFAFLSDAFIRNLVGPVVRIKERRRLEALTSLHMVTNGAMYTAWQTGTVPQRYEQILHATGLQPQDLFMPDGSEATWDGARQVAKSDAYNTLHFATPLIEMPLTNITLTEQREYEQFRLQYLGLWRQYFDPIGMRMSLDKDEIKVETYILPLVRTTQYNELRRIAGDGTIKVDSSMFSDKTLFKSLLHLSPRLFERDIFGVLASDFMVDLTIRSWLGDWCVVRLDDSPVYAELMESYVRSQMFPEERHDYVDDLALLCKTPLTIGIDVRSPLVFAGVLANVRKAMESTLPGTIEWAPLVPPYKGVTIMRVQSKGEALGLGNPSLYYAMIGSAFYVSFKKEPIKDLIDRGGALPDQKDKKTNSAEVNGALYLSPRAAQEAKGLVRLYLEYETHRRAQANNRVLYALFRSNVVGTQAAIPAVEAAALQYLGFVPVSPDLAPFRFDQQYQEVINLRHGSIRQPTLNLGAETDAALAKTLDQFMTIRADLRFREDGIHTTLKMTRKR